LIFGFAVVVVTFDITFTVVVGVVVGVEVGVVVVRIRPRRLRFRFRRSFFRGILLGTCFWRRLVFFLGFALHRSLVQKSIIGTDTMLVDHVVVSMMVLIVIMTSTLDTASINKPAWKLPCWFQQILHVLQSFLGPFNSRWEDTIGSLQIGPQFCELHQLPRQKWT